MNDIFELWSLPWHALQRSLAEAFGAESAVHAASTSKSSISRNLPTPTGSWLVRARNGATLN